MSQDKGVLGYRVSPITISITFDDGRPVSIARDNPNFLRIADKLGKKDHSGLYALCNPAEGIKTYFNGGITVKNGAIYMGSEKIEHAIVPTILKNIAENQDPSHLLRFLSLLQMNPSMNSRTQLWSFIEKNGITVYNGDPIRVTHTVNAPDTARVPSAFTVPQDVSGWLVMYKGVNNDLTDCHTSTFKNEPGTVFLMPRANVDDNQNAACSKGFHAGAYEYVKSFGSRKLLVLVNPADIVSVPTDSSAQKVRTSRYYVLKEVPGGTEFTAIPTSVFDNKEDFTIEYWETEFDDEPTYATVRATDAAAAVEDFDEPYFSLISVNPA